ncbi:MAG TPA: hypothetical protein PLI09_07190 [Candidatus Hydrogenedentes bacterium]|nr:hypothetical protein [Candidatus Hydrogenedentota bacterium]
MHTKSFRLAHCSFTYSFLLIAAVALSCAVLLVGCARTKVTTTVLRPAKINLVGVKALAIGGVKGEGGIELRANIVKAVFDCGKYDVVDRENLRAGITELELQQSGIGTGDQAIGVQRADALITGSVDQRCSQRVESGKFERTNSQGIRYTVILYRRVADASVTLSVSVTNLKTMKCEVVDRIPASKPAFSDWEESPPPPFEPRDLYDYCYANITQEFMKSIAPYSENVLVFLFKASHVPDVKAGIQLFRAGQCNQALTHFEAAAQAAKSNPKVKPKEMSAILFDIGVAKEYSSDYDGALASVNEAIGMCPNRKRYSQAISRIELRRIDARKLVEQGVITAK